jgi:hypothetical protein
MTIDGKRDEFSAALSTVVGVRGYARRPSTIKSGDGWPMWDGSERSSGDSWFSQRWRVLVALPGDEDAASTWVDEHWDDLFDALQPVAYIDEFRPAQLPVAGAPTFALEILMRSE